MKTIYKYPIEIASQQDLRVHEDAKFLHVVESYLGSVFQGPFVWHIYVGRNL